MAGYSDGIWWSHDGLRLHYRDYPGSDDKAPLICIPGLTRNARDFAGFAERFSGRRRIIAVDLRGRGESAYAKDPMTYVPLTYVRDLEALVVELKLERFGIVGTSLGGLIAMVMAATDAKRLAGVVLNDVGPVLDPIGLARIRTYVGKGSTWPTWMHAARYLQEGHGDVYPDYEIDDWIAMAKRQAKLTPAGRVVLDYDMKIAEPFRAANADAPVDMWPVAAALGAVPVLVVRGERSDILSAAIADEMAARIPTVELATIARVGHTPTLDEPDAVAALEAFLARID
ncbi:alpha/beta hydrolase [Sphingomonas naphthae]|uniref:Alpha/beta hydrolase n=1 Tax=Sphingomonas naphthae TaxID=1813468 RepID=A0ABY7TGL7_9SPHN|nr:alpha/beta hydrolase [Sphingomonas naphthae]WCT71966.1 alpha/beta hydrolase [Sphingomonas naphthae]